MVRVLRYPRLSILACSGAFAAAIARDVSAKSALPGLSGLLLTLTLLFLLAGLCLLSCRFLVDREGVGVGFLFRIRRTAWEDLHALGTLVCNSRRVYLYGLYKSSPDFLHMLNRAPRCGRWGFVVPMSKRLACAVATYSPIELDLYTGVLRRKEKGMRPVWHHALLQLATAIPAAAAALLTAGALVLSALASAAFIPCAARTGMAFLLAFVALQLLYRAYLGLQTCPHISEQGVSMGRTLYLPWSEVRFGYVHRMGRVSALYLLSAPLDQTARMGGAPIVCLSMPDTSTLLLAYLTYCPHARKSEF